MLGKMNLIYTIYCNMLRKNMYYLLNNYLIYIYIFIEWSILYVVIILVAMFVTTVVCFWSIACFCNRICMTKQKIKKYKLVGIDEDNHSMKS